MKNYITFQIKEIIFTLLTHKWQKQSQSHKWKQSQSLFQDALTYRLWRVHVRVVFCIVATVCSQHYFKYLVCFDYSIFYKQTYKNEGIVSVQKSVKCVNIFIALGKVMCLTQISNSYSHHIAHGRGWAVSSSKVPSSPNPSVILKLNMGSRDQTMLKPVNVEQEFPSSYRCFSETICKDLAPRKTQIQAYLW